MPEELIEVEDIPTPEGHIVTERTSNDYGRRWDTLVEICQNQTNIAGIVIDAIRGGLVVDLGVHAFLPRSEVDGRRPAGDLTKLIGETVEVKVLEADRDSNRLVVSQRKVVDEQRKAQREATMASLERGEIVDGVVRRITDFGAFVDIGGVDGLLHVSDMAWERVEHPSSVVTVGQQLQVKILKIENNGDRISLGLKQLEDDPWTVARNEVREGDVIEVTILRLTDFGAVAQVRQGVEGVIPTRELGQRRPSGDEATPASKLEPGQTVTVKVTEFRARERRLTLSIKQAAREQERSELREFQKRQQQENAPLTLGDMFGDVFSKLQNRE
jgi:small subunit ribosomal protein S1